MKCRQPQMDSTNNLVNIYIYIYIFIYKYIYIYICICIYICIYLSIYIYIYSIYIYVCIYICIYIHILLDIHHWIILRSNYRKLALVEIEPTIVKFCPDTLTDWAFGPWVQLILRANFLQFHLLISVKFNFDNCLHQWPCLFHLSNSLNSQN